MIVLSRPVTGLSERALARFTARAQRAIGLRGEVNILVAGNEELQALNSRFRGKHKATDVLSFPAMARARGIVGDVAISADMAASNAARLGHATMEELKILVVHGLLHLAGYDHEQDQGEMARRELLLRKRLGLPSGLIERYQLQNRAKPKAFVVTRKSVALKGRRRTRAAPGIAGQKTR